MNFKKVWVITKSLLLSQLRATATGRRMGSIRSLIRRPRVLGLLDVLAFVIVSGLTYLVASSIVGTSIEGVVSAYTKSGIVIMPAILMAMVVLFGLIFEITSSYQFSSSDTVNWLPVRAPEYVLASTLALLMYYSVVPVIVIAGAFSLAYTFGMIPAWELATLLSVFGVFFAASVLEVMRAILNRFSSSFYKKGGQVAVAIRAMFGVLILVAFQIMLYPTFYTRFIGSVSPSFGPSWAVPILWASVSVAALFEGALATSVTFAVLSIVLALALFYVAVAARSKYWVPMPASIRISTAAYAPKNRPSLLGLMSVAQFAIARKDLRGLFRRKEMIRFLSLPVVFLVPLAFGFSSSGASDFVVYFAAFIAGIASFFLASSSVGAEGKSIMTLYVTPVGPKDFLIGKAAIPALFGSSFGVLFFIGLGILFRSAQPQMVLFFLILSIALSVELSLVGIYIGARFPNFSEAPRSAYMSQTAALIAFPFAAFLIGIPLSPLFLVGLLGSGLVDALLGFAVSLALTVAISLIFYFLSSVQVRRLLSQIPV